jgi:HAD superfamily hydrolase (TIGR01490 family)
MAERANARAFFDLDRTLISGSSAFYFGVAAWRNKLIPTGDLLRDGLKAVSFKLFGATDESSEAVRDRILQAVEGANQADLIALNEEIVPRILDRIRPESRGLIDMHHEAGRDCWIVSASPIEMVDPLATALGMEGAIATTSEVVDGATPAGSTGRSSTARARPRRSRSWRPSGATTCACPTPTATPRPTCR